VTAALDEAKEALKGEDVDRIKQTTEALMTASQQIAQVIYQSAQSQPGGGGNAATGSSDDDVVDAEVVDEEDGKEQSA
jgi:molecular chaperone DnaK